MELITAHSILEEIHTEGHSPLKIVGSDFNTYVAKNSKGHSPAYALISEWLCHEFLRLWNIETPDCKIIQVDKELVQNTQLSSHHSPSVYNFPCFGSLWVEDFLDMNDQLISTDKKGFNKLINPVDVLRIGLFDFWMENDDRRASNYNLLLKANKGKYQVIPIDHAFTLSSMSYLSLNPENYIGRSNEHLFDSNLGRLVRRYVKTDKSMVSNEKENFYICLQECQANFNDLLDQISNFFPLTGVDRKCLHAYLFNSERNTNVFKEYVYWLTI